jgi:hypothetical protein
LVIAQKTVMHTPLDKVHDAVITLLAGAHGLVEINTRLRSDPVLQAATVVLGELRDDPAGYDAEVRDVLARADGRRIWLVMSHQWGDEFKSIPRRFAKHRLVESKGSFPGGRLFLLNPK